MQKVTTYLRIDAAMGWTFDPVTLDPKPSYMTLEQTVYHDDPLMDFELVEIHQDAKTMAVTQLRIPPHYIKVITEAEYMTAMSGDGPVH